MAKLDQDISFCHITVQLIDCFCLFVRYSKIIDREGDMQTHSHISHRTIPLNEHI